MNPKRTSSLLLRTTVLVGWLSAAHTVGISQARAAAMTMSYSGRLIQPSGAPLEGTLPIEARFWTAAADGAQLGRTISFPSVDLTNGVFTVDLPFSLTETSVIFGSSGDEPVFIEITANGKLYPRQKFSYVPYALQIPVDGQTIKFGTNGKLTLAVGSAPGENQFLTKDGAGNLMWGSPSVTKLQNQSVSETAPTSGQILKYNGSQWVAANQIADSQSFAGILPVTSGGTGVDKFSNNGVLIGSSGALSSTPAGSEFNALVAGSGGQPGFGQINLATSSAVSGILSVANGGSGLNTLPNNAVLLGNGTDPLLSVAPGTNGHVLTSNGTTWQSIALPATDWASPGAIGATTPNTGSFTTLTASGNVGIGSTAAPVQLDLNGQIKITGGSPGAGKVLTSNADGLASWTQLAVGSVTSVNTGVGLTGGPVTYVGTIGLADTSVTPNSYTRANITVDQQGRLTAASDGSAIVDNDIDAAANISQSKINGLTTSLSSKEPAIAMGSGTQYWRGDKTWATLNTTAVSEGTNQYFTPARAISSLSSSAPITYSTVTGTIGISQASGTVNGYLSSTDWTTFNSKQNALGYAPVNKAGDTMNGALNADGFDLLSTGNIQMATSKTLTLSNNSSDPVGLSAADEGKTWYNATSNQIRYWDGSAAQTLGIVGGSLNSLNSQTGSTQTFGTPGTSGTAPGWSSASNVHTLNIPMASASSVTAGLISNTDYTAFSNKVTNVAQGTGIAVSTASGTATVSLAAAGTAGTYTKVTTDNYGRVTSSTTLVPADIPPLSASAITSGVLGVANGGTGAATLTANNVLLGNGTSAPLTVAPGGNGNVLTSNGTTWQSSALPTTNWAAPGAIGSTTPNAGSFTTISSSTQAGFEVKPYGSAAGSTGEIRLSELAANGSHYVGIKAPDIIGTNKIWVLPAADGSAGHILKTDGAGNLGWISPDTAFVDRMNWDGNPTGLVAATGRSSLGLGSLATLSAVGSTEITDSSITDADISGAAMITDTKLATISAPGKVSGSAITSGTITGNTEISISGTIATTGSVGIGTTSPNSAAKLEVTSTSQGFLPPRLTSTQRNAITNPPAGLMVWDTTTSSLHVYTGSGWMELGGIVSGTIAFFDRTTCPSGWSEKIDLRGRYVVGLPSGGTVGSTSATGTALTNKENRPVGQHNHGISDPGHAHGTSWFVTNPGSGGTDMSGFGGSGVYPYKNGTSAAGTGISIKNAGSVAGTNAPYLQLLPCEKN